MKKISVLLPATLIVSCLFFSNCDKDDDPPAQPTKTELLTSSSWKFKSANEATFGDVSANIPACYKDNLFTFSANNTGSINEGANVCSPSSAGPFTWNFQTNETKLFISTVLFPNGSQTFDFVSVSADELVLFQQVTPPLSQTLHVTFKFQH